MTNTVYLIQAEGTNSYKIGFTNNKPTERLKQLQTGNGTKLELVKEFKTKYGSKLEGQLHRHFRSKRTEGEWFMLETEDVKQFESVCIRYENNFDALKDNPYMVKFLR